MVCVLADPFLTQLPHNGLRNTEKMAQMLGNPVTHMEDSDEVTGSWLWRVPVLVIAAIWGSKSAVENSLFLSVSRFLSVNFSFK